MNSLIITFNLQPESPAKIFLSCALEDQEMRDELVGHLNPLKRQRRITLWLNSKIQPGMEQRTEITAHLEEAHIILLLISADFFSTDHHCYDEMQMALERHKTGSASVIPILLRPVRWRDTPLLGTLQPLPHKPITEWAN